MKEIAYTQAQKLKRYLADTQTDQTVHLLHIIYFIYVDTYVYIILIL